jgi:hypothetical protein
VLPYWLKIVFGSVELVLLTAFLALAGRRGMGVSPMSFFDPLSPTVSQETHGRDAHATRRPQE